MRFGIVIKFTKFFLHCGNFSSVVVKFFGIPHYGDPAIKISKSFFPKIIIILNSKLYIFVSVCLIVTMAEESLSGTPKRKRVDSGMEPHPIFGDVQEKLPSTRFPSMLNVVNHVRYLKAHKLAGNIGIYNSVTDHLMAVWKSAYAVPLVERNTIYQSVQSYTEDKLAYVRRVKSRLIKPEQSDAKESLISDMKKVFVISKCKCFVNVETREEIIRTNCKCKPSNQIINLAGFGDQMFYLREIIVFEEEKAIFEEKMAENFKTSPAKLKPGSSSSSKMATNDYEKYYPEFETPRPRPAPGSYAKLEDSGLDIDVDEPITKYKYERFHNTIGKKRIEFISYFFFINFLNFRTAINCFFLIL